ncbi:MAG: hypothetical protein RIE73_08835 [Coleofasciculus sp. C1-SOL-03]|jgi:predicted nucleic acid-binding protein|uniref:hypothetical protein n=1 Tax=Coleofasciculus sp. C1-SOL-03 TaxID=3069522 RepID=UPI0032F80A84
MTDLWVDANVLLRLLTGEPSGFAQRSLRLVERAERGEVTLTLSPNFSWEVQKPESGRV